ncbi:TPM domain-containing protein [Pendulispora brunnea]|uniref:TPM domain-containing protein n=1 Tax=Pendulispora brunnea TaxID=2905690 RepID=A0ABZ2KIP2_9BACT
MALLVAVLAWAFAVRPAYAFTPPKIAGHVTDAAGKLSDGDRRALNEKLAAYRAKTKNEIAVFIVRSLEGETIDDVAYATFNAWKIGVAGKDNGVLLVIAPNERRVRIETGKGIGDKVTDLQANDIIRSRIGPRLKQEQFREAIDDGTSALMALLDGKSAPSAAPTASATSTSTASTAAAETPPAAAPTPPPLNEKAKYRLTSYFTDENSLLEGALRASYDAETAASVKAGKKAIGVLVLPRTEEEPIGRIHVDASTPDGVIAVLLVRPSTNEVYVRDIAFPAYDEYRTAMVGVEGAIEEQLRAGRAEEGIRTGVRSLLELSTRDAEKRARRAAAVAERAHKENVSDGIFLGTLATLFLGITVLGIRASRRKPQTNSRESTSSSSSSESSSGFSTYTPPTPPTFTSAFDSFPSSTSPAPTVDTSPRVDTSYSGGGGTSGGGGSSDSY